MTRIYYCLYGPYIVKFIEPKNSLGYKYKDAGFVLSLLDKIALKNDVDSIVITKELEEEYGLKRPNESEKARYNRMQILHKCGVASNAGATVISPLETYLSRTDHYFISADLSEPEGTQKVAEEVLSKFGKLDILINSLGGSET